MTSVRWAWLSGLVAALVVTPAYSQHRESGDVYMGAALGYHLVPDAEDELQGHLNADPETRGVLASVDDGAIGWGVYGGFAVTDELALEAGYLGNADMGITLRGRGASADVDLSLSGFYAAVVAGFPMPQTSRVYPFVKVGIVRWETETTFNLGPVTFSDEDSETDPLFGAGIDVPGVGTGTFRGEYIFFLDTDDDGGVNHHRFQAGINFTF